MKTLKYLILQFLLERGDSLTYFQLERKLKNEGRYELVDSLRGELKVLLEENLIIEDDSTSPSQYSISELGQKTLQDL